MNPLVEVLARAAAAALYVALRVYLEQRGSPGPPDGSKSVELPRIAVVLRRALWRRAARAGGARQGLWRQAAVAAGLEDVRGSAGELLGRKGIYRVRLEAWESRDGAGTHIVVQGLRHEPPGNGLTLRLEGPGPMRAGPREIELGDEAFDRAVSVEGPPALARAVLDADTRGAVAGLVAGNLAVSGRTPLRIAGQLEQGELSILVPETTFFRIRTSGELPDEVSRGFLAPEARLPEVLRAALDLAARLDEPRDVALRIADNTAREPDPAVRRRNLLTLVREFPGTAPTHEALHAACSDPDAEVRLQAGIALGQEGQRRLDDRLVRKSLDALRAVAWGADVADATRARATAALGPALGAEEARRLLHEALRTRRAATAVACLGALGAKGGADAIEALGKVLAVEKDELATAAAEALARTGDPVAERPLLRALSDGSPAVRVAVARALGRVGKTAAIAPLLEAESEGGELRRAARQAVAEIRSRLAGAAGAQPGQLSLAGGEAGQLSLAADEPGRLSLVDAGTTSAPGGRRRAKE